MWKRVLYFCSILLVFLIVLIYYGKSYFKLENENTNLVSLENGGEDDVIETSFEEEKVRIDTKLSVDNIFDECEHIDKEEMSLPTEIINMKEDELREYFENKGYTLKDFSNEEIILEKNFTGICKNHFVIKFGNDNDDFLSVYKLDENSELSLYKETDIAKEFLTIIDNQKLEEGIEVYGYDNVEIVLEDFE